MVATVRLIQALFSYFKYAPKAVTIIGNCAIPILALFIVMLVNEFQHYMSVIEDSEDGE
jgi:hypothetical protein